jgi:hypothetical protein
VPRTPPLIAKLDADEFATRERATKALEGLGVNAEAGRVFFRVLPVLSMVRPSPTAGPAA